MSEPTSATITTIAAVAAAPAFGIDPMLAIGAITGAGIFIISHEELNTIKKLLLFAASVACGFVGANFAADVAAVLIPGEIDINDGVGAIIASAVSVRVLQRALRTINSSGSLQEIIKGRKS